MKNKASKGYEENYFFIFREGDGVYYNELETRYSALFHEFGPLCVCLCFKDHIRTFLKLFVPKDLLCLREQQEPAYICGLDLALVLVP